MGRPFPRRTAALLCLIAAAAAAPGAALLQSPPEPAAAQSAQATPGLSQDPLVREKVAEQLLAAGDPEGALRELLWCFDEGPKVAPDYRLTAHAKLPARILALSDRVPGARAELIRRRDAADEQLGKPELFDDARLAAALDFAVLNEALGDRERTLAAFDRVLKAENDPVTPSVLVNYVGEELLRQKRYDDFLKACGSPQRVLNARIQAIETLRAGATGEQRWQVMEYVLQLVGESGRIYQALIGANKINAADRFAERLIKFAPRPETYATLIERAASAGNVEKAREIAAHAITVVRSEDQSIIARALGRTDDLARGRAPASQPESQPDSQPGGPPP